MGKQINYWMDFDSFIKVALKALELGCIIYRRHPDKSGKLTFGNNIDIVTAEEPNYFFYFPQAGEIRIDSTGNKKSLKIIGENCLVLIEASFSNIDTGEKIIHRGRLWCSTGFYSEDGKFVPRPEQLTKAYNSLERAVKVLAPYTEVTDMLISTKGADYGKEYEYRHKEYISRLCAEKKAQGYRLCL